MVIKGYIVSIPEPGDNHFQVRIPFIEDNTGVEIIMTALLCSQPGVYGGYDIGDCVFVSFEGDKHMDDDVITDTPVIIGKLYQDEPTGVHNNCIIESLTVSSKAELPSNTTFGGQSAADIFDLIQNVNVINNSLKDLEEKIEKIEQDSEIDWDSVKSIREELDEFKDKVDSEIEEIEEKLSNLPTEEEIQEIISEVSDLTTEIEELSSEIIGLSSTVNNLSETVDGIIGNYVDLSTNQVIDGQKDFEVTPRVKIDSDYKPVVTSDYHDDSKQNKLIAGDNITLTPTQSAGTNKFEVVTTSTAISASPTSNVSVYTTTWYRGVSYNGYFNMGILPSVTIENNKVTFQSGDPSSYGLCKFVALKPSTTYTVSWVSSLANNGKIAISKYLLNASGTTYKFNRYLATPSWSPTSFTTDADTNALYGFIFYAGTAGVDCDYYNIQIEEGLSPTPYVPYQAIYADRIDVDCMNFLISLPGYDGTVSQTLKHNANGVIQWVND